MSKFTIDFFELSFLAEVCIPPVPIARHSFWYDLINVHYELMSDEERTKLHGWITQKDRFDILDSDCKLFDARFNPANQYTVEIQCEGVKEVKDAFLLDGNYYVKINTWIDEKYIIDKYPKNTF